MKLSNVLVEFLKNSDKTAQEIAKETGVSTATITRYKAGKGIENIEKLFDYFTHNVSNTDFLNAIDSVRKTKEQIYKSFADEKLAKGEITENQHKFLTQMTDGMTYNFEKDEVFVKKHNIPTQESLQFRFFVETLDSYEFYFQMIGGSYDHCEEYIQANDLKTAYQLFIKRYTEVNMITITYINSQRERKTLWKQGEPINYL